MIGVFSSRVAAAAADSAAADSDDPSADGVVEKRLTFAYIASAITGAADAAAPAAGGRKLFLCTYPV